MLLERGDYGPFFLARGIPTGLFRARVMLDEKDWERLEYGPYENPQRSPRFIGYLNTVVGAGGKDWFITEGDRSLIILFRCAEAAQEFESVWQKI